LSETGSGQNPECEEHEPSKSWQWFKLRPAELSVLAVIISTVGALSAVAQFAAPFAHSGAGLIGITLVVSLVGISIFAMVTVIINRREALNRRLGTPLGRALIVLVFVGFGSGSIGYYLNQTVPASASTSGIGTTSLATNDQPASSAPPSCQAASLASSQGTPPTEADKNLYCSLALSDLTACSAVPDAASTSVLAELSCKPQSVNLPSSLIQHTAVEITKFTSADKMDAWWQSWNSQSTSNGEACDGFPDTQWRSGRKNGDIACSLPVSSGMEYFRLEWSYLNDPTDPVAIQVAFDISTSAIGNSEPDIYAWWFSSVGDLLTN
jgi:hypothetical protein